MNNPSNNLVKTLEAYIFSAGMPVSEAMMKKLYPEEAQPTTAELRAALDSLKAQYHDRGVVLHEVASGYRFQVAEDMLPQLGLLWEERPVRYSRALLETLALVAYRQPITRGEIEEIRGVVVSTQMIKTLMDQEWIRVVGHRDVPGRPALYATTKSFLDHFNLKNLESLPALAPLKDLTAFSEVALEGVGTTEIPIESGDRAAAHG